MKFGSRIDVFLGSEWTVSVQAGERVAAASSVLAELKPALSKGTA
jgi:hypothetical protein